MRDPGPIGAARRWLRDLRRRVLCGVVGSHVGTVESTTVTTEQYELMLTYLPCARCGRLVPLNLTPRHVVEGAIYGAADQDR